MELTYDVLYKIIKSEKFLDIYNKNKNNEIYLKTMDFLDDVDNNKNYYHLSINKNKIIKKSKNEDTIIIKNINSLVNKTTEKTFDNIKKEIEEKIKDKKYLHSLIIDNLIEISILNPDYIFLYVKFLKLFNNDKLISNKCKKVFNLLFNKNTNNSKSEYINLCDMNKKTDNMISFSLFITYLESDGIISGHLNSIIDKLFENINKYDDNDDNNIIYQNLLTIEKILDISKYNFKDKEINILNNLKNNKLSKIRFKIMDILKE